MNKYIEISDFQPNSFNIKELEKNNWYQNGKLSEEFIILYQMYYKLLEKYIDKALNITEMDQIIKESQFHFKEVDSKEKDIYQTFSEFSYFYLRNTLYIEKLDELELQELKKKISSNDTTLDEDTELLIKNSYEKVITTDNVEKSTMINYGPHNAKEYYAQNNALVLGVRYDPEYDASRTNPDYDDNLWDENNDKQMCLIRAVINTVNEEAQDKLVVPVKTIEYDENSVNMKEYVTPSLSRRKS